MFAWLKWGRKSETPHWLDREQISREYDSWAWDKIVISDEPFRADEIPGHPVVKAK